MGRNSGRRLGRVVEVLADRSRRSGVVVLRSKGEEKRHHRRGEVGEGHLPRTAMVTVALLDHLLDDNGRRLAHASPRRNSSSSKRGAKLARHDFASKLYGDLRVITLLLGKDAGFNTL